MPPISVASPVQWYRRILPLVTAIVVIGLGAWSLASWLLVRPEWVQVAPTVAPMQPYAAVGFILCGAGLAAVYFGWFGTARTIGFLVAIVSLLVFSEYALAIDLPFQAFLSPSDSELLSASRGGRVAPNGAVAFVLAGLALVFSGGALLVQALVGSLVSTLGAIALLGYATGVSAAFAWGPGFSDLDPLAAAGFLLLGAGLVVQSLHAQAREERGPAPWVPVVAGIAATVAGLLLWQALRSQEMNSFHRVVDSTAEAVAHDVELRLDPLAQALRHLAATGVTEGWMDVGSWAAGAKVAVGSFPSFDSIWWVDPDAPPTLLASRDPLPRQLPGRLPLPHPTGDAPHPRIMEPIDVGGQPMLPILMPLAAESFGQASLLGLFSADDIFAPLAQTVAPGYDVALRSGSKVVFATGSPIRNVDAAWVRREPIDLPGPSSWLALVAPEPRLLAAQRTGLPEIALGAGVLLGLLLTLTVRLGEVETRRARQFEEAVRDRTRELEKAVRAVEQAKAEAQSASAAKDRFLATLGHELRNPLGSISTALEVLARQPDKPGLDEHMQGIVRRQVTHLARLVDDLLDVSRIERGKLVLRRERLDLSRLVADTAESHRQALEKNGLWLHVSLPEAPVWVEGDETRLTQVLGNLLTNAQKFTDPGGTVDVRLLEEAGVARIEVQDTGCGLADGELEHVFKPFAQSEAAISRLAGGLGLGLPIVRGLVEAHEGSIRAWSEGEGRGTTFVVRLPRVMQPPAGEVHRGAKREASGPLRILVIDDHRDSASGLAELLSLLGHEADVAYDGPGGLELARAHDHDVVISDLGLPGMDGYEVARRLRQEHADRRLLLCALSGYGDAAAIQQALDSGFDHHFTKPVDAALLQRTLAEARPDVATTEAAVDGTPSPPDERVG